MNNLTPQKRVNKNGVAVIKHVKLDTAPATPRKPIAAPTLSQKEIDKQRPLRKVKPRKLSPVSAKDVNIAALRFADRKMHDLTPVPMSDDQIYEYLRYGLKFREAVALRMVGLEPYEIASAPAQEEGEPDSRYLSRTQQIRIEATAVEKRQFRYADVSHRLWLKDVPAEVASKCLENGVAMEHFDRYLEDEQVVGLFSKVTNTKNNQNAINLLITGKYSYEHFEKFGIRSINKWMTVAPETMDMEPDLIEKAISKAKDAMPPINSAPDEVRMIKLAAKHGEEVLELRLPELMWHGFRTPADGGQFSLEEAKYMDDFIHEVRSRGITDLTDQTKYLTGLNEKYPKPDATERDQNTDSKYPMARIMTLHDAGLQTDEIIRSLQNRWTDEQAIAVYKENVPSSLADGVL